MLLPKVAPVTSAALLAALVFIFAFQADGRLFACAADCYADHRSVYFNAGITHTLIKWLKVKRSSIPLPHPEALTGASNFFELAGATAIALFGPQFCAAPATVVSVLVEVLGMLSVCAARNRTRHWFPTRTASGAACGL